MVWLVAPGIGIDRHWLLWSICTIIPRGVLPSALVLLGMPDRPARRRLSRVVVTQVCGAPRVSRVALIAWSPALPVSKVSRACSSRRWGAAAGCSVWVGNWDWRAVGCEDAMPGLLRDTGVVMDNLQKPGSRWLLASMSIGGARAASFLGVRGCRVDGMAPCLPPSTSPLPSF